MALPSPLKDEPILGRDLFTTKEVASRSYERVWVALTEMGIAVASISRLGKEAQRQMINDMEV
jgi:hypothetical protein